jgi:hypothetical protein
LKPTDKPWPPPPRDSKREYIAEGRVERLIQRLEIAPVVCLDHHQVREDAAVRQMMIERAEAAAAIRSLLAEIERRDRALQSLTPGGSEYVNDPERCVSFVRERHESQFALLKKFKLERDEQSARAEKAEAENDKLRDNSTDWYHKFTQALARAEKAEAELAQLRLMELGKPSDSRID